MAEAPSAEGEFLMQSSDYVRQFRLGDARIAAISDGSGLSTIVKQLMVPEAQWRREVDADENGEIRVGYNVAHVRLGAASILIDLGFDDPSPASQWQAPRHHRSPGVEAGLAVIGVAPEDVTHVLITHAHGDHIAGGSIELDGDSQRVPRFPRARHYLGRADWESNPAREDPTSLVSVHLGPIADAKLLDLVDGPTEIVPGVTMIPAPGESPGHCLVRVESRGQVFYHVGDVFHHPCEARHLDWAPRGRDVEAMAASRAALIRDALATDALLMTSHMPFPGLGRLSRDRDGARWQDV